MKGIVQMKIQDVEPAAINENENLVGVKRVKEPNKKEPDEETPSITGTEPNLLSVVPSDETSKPLIILKDEEGLLDDTGTVEDGLL